MIRNQGPGVALRLGFFEDVGEPFQERLPVFVIKEDLSSFYSPGHDVLEKAWGIKSWLAGHGLQDNGGLLPSDFIVEPLRREVREGFLVFFGSG